MLAHQSSDAVLYVPMSEVRVFRGDDGFAQTALIAGDSVALDRVAERIDEPVECRLETPTSTSKRRCYEPGDYLLHPNGSVIERSAQTGPRSMLGPQIVLHAGVIVNNAILYQGVELREGVRIERDASVGKFARIGEGAVLETNAHFGDRSVADVRLFMGKSAQLGMKSTVERDVKINGGNFAGQVTIGHECLFEGGQTRVESGVRFGKSSSFGVNLDVRQDARFGESVIVGDGNKFGIRVFVGNNTETEDGVTVENKGQVAEDCWLGEGVTLGYAAVLGSKCKIGSNTYIGPSVELADCTRIYPYSHIATRKVPHAVWPIPANSFDARKS